MFDILGGEEGGEEGGCKDGRDLRSKVRASEGSTQTPVSAARPPFITYSKCRLYLKLTK